jgi:hypothetical protein
LPASDATGERRDDFVAPRADGVVVDLGLGDLDPEVAGVANLGQHIGDAQHGLRRDARVVQATTPDAILLDHRGLHPQLGGADRGDISARTRPDNDAVIRGFGHVCEPS